MHGPDLNAAGDVAREGAQGAANSENFSLHDFVPSSGKSLEERVAPFSSYFRQSVREERAFYSREIVGPMGPQVQVRDLKTGKTRPMIMMGSNDYLGFSNHPLIRQRVKEAVDRCGVGMGGPPLLNGMSALHRELELQIAELKGMEDSLLYTSGYQAHLGWVPALLRSSDVLIYDELNHASLFDALRLGRSIHRFRALSFRHNDIDSLGDALARAQKSRKDSGLIFVVVEGVYSMDGDLAPLPEIAALCKEFAASLVVDDAHGTGVIGPGGAGAAAHFGVSRDVTLAIGTFSKAFGVTGGFIAGKRETIDFLRFFSRSYMFSAHMTPPTVAAVLGGLEVLEKEPERRSVLMKNVAELVGLLNRAGIPVKSETPIIPIPVPAHVDIRALSRKIDSSGVFVNAIEPPAVARNAQRIRLSVMSEHLPEHLLMTVQVLEQAAREFDFL